MIPDTEEEIDEPERRGLGARGEGRAESVEAERSMVVKF